MNEHGRNPRVYLAGKINQSSPWRVELFDYDCIWDANVRNAPSFSFRGNDEALDPETTVTIETHSGPVDVVGPFFVGLDHDVLAGAEPHALNYEQDILFKEEGISFDREPAQKAVHGLSVARIKRADFVFACINEVDCFGTIAEIGIAYGLGIPVHLFFGGDLTPEQRCDLWFVGRCAASVHERISIPHAFRRAMNFQRHRSKAKFIRLARSAP